jgi:tRNA1(Val) A37 N6-methylase TrmN6
MPRIEDVTKDAVLGGRLTLWQPRRGHRVGHDAILLAAATAAAGGERAVEFGAGVGAAGLALAARVPGLAVTLVEVDRGLAALAAKNAGLNGLADRVCVVAADACDPDALAAAGITPGSSNRVLMNPPFHDPARHNLSPDPGRRRAYAGGLETLARWCAAAARVLASGGVLTLIWRADELDEIPGVLASAFDAIAVLPVLPRPGAKPIRVLVRARKGQPAARLTACPALILNDEAGRPSAAAEAILRGGAVLPLEPA